MLERRRITILPSVQLAAETVKVVPELAFTDAVQPVAVLPWKSKSAASSPSTEDANDRLKTTGELFTDDAAGAKEVTEGAPVD